MIYASGWPMSLVPAAGLPGMTTSTGTYAEVNGVTMYYEIHGSGRPIVLLHGGLMTIDMAFAALIPQLAPDRQVIAVELQGHGHTADIDREIDLGHLAGDVVGLLDVLGVERADLLGFSLGGLVAFETAVRYPARVDRLVVASIQFRADGFHEEIRNPELWATSTRMPAPDDFAAMQAAYARVAPDPDHFQEFAAKTSGAVQALPGWSDDTLRGISAPTLVVVGDHDFVRLEHAVAMQELIPGAQLAVLPGAKHMDVPQRTDVLVPILKNFLPHSPS